MAASGMEPLPPDINHGPTILAVSWIECGLALVAVITRMYCRAKLIHNVGWDDWTMIFTMLLALVCTGFVTAEVYFGVGRHIVYLQPPDVVQAVKMIWMTQPFSTMSACFGKISVALLLMRLMNRNRPQEIALWFIIVSLFIVNLMCVIVTFAQCTPVWQLWEGGPPPNPHCWDPKIQQNFGYAQAAYSSFTDLVLALFPILIIWKLKMETRIKLGLIGVMSLGVFATAAAIVKTIELRNLTSPDFTYNATTLAYWFMTENFVIIIAACVPTFRPLFKVANAPSFQRYRIFAKKSQSYGSSSYGSASHATSRRKARSWLKISAAMNSQNSEEIALSNQTLHANNNDLYKGDVGHFSAPVEISQQRKKGATDTSLKGSPVAENAIKKTTRIEVV